MVKPYILCGHARCIGGALIQDNHGDVLVVLLLGYAVLEHLMEPLLLWWMCMVMDPCMHIMWC